MKIKGPQPFRPTRAILQQNAILGGLSSPVAEEVIESTRLVVLETPQQIYYAGVPIREVYFPIDSVLSVVTQMRDGGSIEVGTVGREGVSGIPLLLGASTSANGCFCQVPGRGVVMSSEHFRQLLGIGGDEFRGRVDRFLQAYVNMLGQLAACNGMHNIYERCARWLLLTHDRVNCDAIALTHEYLAMMLGARRSGVTIAAAAFQTAGFIRYGRGHITILDRKGLEEAACECYSVARAQFGPLLGLPQAKGHSPERRRAERPWSSLNKESPVHAEDALGPPVIPALPQRVFGDSRLKRRSRGAGSGTNVKDD